VIIITFNKIYVSTTNFLSYLPAKRIIVEQFNKIRSNFKIIKPLIVVSTRTIIINEIIKIIAQINKRILNLTLLIINIILAIIT